MLKLAFRMTMRDWRAGQLRFLLVAMVVAIAALSSVGFFVERIKDSIQRDALQLLGADLVINADQPPPAAWREKAAQLGLQSTDTTIFPSMAIAGSGEQTNSRLVALKAVGQGYPLRGRVKVSADLKTGADGVLIGSAASGIPARGTAWVDSALLTALQLKLGQQLRLGDMSFTVSHVIVNEADRGAAFMNFAPRVMIARDDLQATNLIQLGSRVTYKLLLNGKEGSPNLKIFQDWVQAEIERTNLKGTRIETLESGRPEMQNTINRAEQFLALVGLLTALLAAVAIAIAARRFTLQHIDAYAMLRFLGLRQNQVLAMFITEFLLLGTVASVIGAALGFLAHFALLQWLAALVVTELPPPTIVPALQALITGLLLLLGFALPPLLQLRNVPHNRVIRRDADSPQAASVGAYLLGVVSFVALLLWQARDLKLGLLTAGGFLLGFALFALCAWGLLKFLKRLRPGLRHPAWRFALHSLQRRPGATILQIVSLALGLMALLLLTVERADLFAAWEKATPRDAPNRFVINIQPEQKDEIGKLLLDSTGKAVPMYSMIRGRLLEINGRPTKGSDYEEENTRRLLEREFNLSTMDALPAGNELVGGRWYDPKSARAEASVEQGLAKSLRLKLGDKISFDIAGQKVEAEITSLRKLDWNSMKVNFFVIISPQAMQNMPQTYVTSFHLPPDKIELDNRMSRTYPNLTVVDVSVMLKQVRDVLDQVIAAVQFLFVFTLASGVLVLYAALVGSQEERIRESGLLRALGATVNQLARAQTLEFFMIGSLAGLLAAGGAAGIGYVLARFVFKFEWIFNPWVWGSGAVAGVVCAVLGGWYGLRMVLTQPPLVTLRGS